MYNKHYDLIISDIMMPDVDGFEFARTVRRVNGHIPILFMSARDDLPAKQKGFQLGIDDYMVKPIELDELLMRVRALLRRANIESAHRLAVGNLVLDADAMSAVVDGAGGARHHAGVQHPVQAPLLPEQDLHPRPADGRILGHGERQHAAGGGRVHHQAARQVLRLHGVQDRHRARAGLQGGAAAMKPLPRYFDGIRVPKYVFFMSLGMLMLLSGVHVGLILLLYRINVDSIVLVHVVLLYWVAVAIGLSLYIQRQMRKFYEEPIQRIARAASQVARGDFSVYLPPVHTPDHLDCLDALTEDFNRMTEALGSIETLKTEFFSNVSHEIKTPIAVILNTAELLRGADLGAPKSQEYVETILRSSKRLSTLIADILKLNKLEKQTISPQPEAYDLCAQLAGCALQFENRGRRRASNSRPIWRTSGKSASTRG